MTTLYRPVLIETAEQAEALPEGSIVPVEDKDGPWEKRPDGKFQGAGRVVVDACRVLDRIALVPIEAEEERRASVECEIGVPGSEQIIHERRYVTPWENR